MSIYQHDIDTDPRNPANADDDYDADWLYDEMKDEGKQIRKG